MRQSKDKEIEVKDKIGFGEYAAFGIGGVGKVYKVYYRKTDRRSGLCLCFCGSKAWSGCCDHFAGFRPFISRLQCCSR